MFILFVPNGLAPTTRRGDPCDERLCTSRFGKTKPYCAGYAADFVATTTLLNAAVLLNSSGVNHEPLRRG